MRRIRITYLVAVLLRTVQFVIGETIDVNVWPTEVAIASPPNSTLPGCGDAHVFYIHIQRPCCMSVRQAKRSWCRVKATLFASGVMNYIF